MAKREFLQLAHVFDPKKQVRIGGWYMSEKLDGMRAFWDSGITRGMYADTVPWANTERKGHLVNRPISTGLWSRYGNVIHAPASFLNQLPSLMLDGELYLGRGQFQKLVSVTKRHEDSGGWADVGFMVLDTPPYHAIFGNGEIKNTNFKKTLTGAAEWAKKRFQERFNLEMFVDGPNNWQFKTVHDWLKENLVEGYNVQLHRQEELPCFHNEAIKMVEAKLEEVTQSGGEGLILRNPTTFWVAQRSHSVLKMKQVQDAEGTVTGYVWGRETDLGSKLLGLMGALVLDFNGKRLELSGFTDEERQMSVKTKLDWWESTAAAMVIGKLHPGEQNTNDLIHNPKFPIGSKVTFKYRELTDDGLPKEARYWRKRGNDD